MTIAVGASGAITGATATSGGTLYYYLVDATKQTEIDSWSIVTAKGEVDADLGATGSTSAPEFTESDNGKFLVVVEISTKDKVVAAGQSAAIHIEAK